MENVILKLASAIVPMDMTLIFVMMMTCFVLGAIGVDDYHVRAMQKYQRTAPLYVETVNTYMIKAPFISLPSA